MTQTYQMKHNTQGTIYSLLTVESNGQMTMTFHGTDREICHEATQTEDGWITTGGSLFPGLESGRWQLMADVVETTDCADLTDVEPVVIEETTDCADLTDDEPLTMNPKPLTIEQPRSRRQRKQRKPRVERQEPAIIHQPSAINHQTSDTMKAIGMVAAATVALLVIYETGLLIPLGLIGLATGGILK